MIPIEVTLLFAVLSYSILPTLLLKQTYYLKKLPPHGNKNIYLTFDDGPSDEYTPALLDLLAEYQIKACFFVVADFALSHPELIARIQAEGHLIGMHSAGHQCALLRGPKFIKSDFAKSTQAMKELGCIPQFYRPPWGDFNLFSFYYLHKYHLKPVLWQVMTGDWEKKASAELIKKRLLHRVTPNAIVCMHDGRGAQGAPGRTILALKTAIPELYRRGYSFCRLDQRYVND